MTFTAALGLLAVAVGVLLALVLVLRIHGFVALLAVSILVALAGGISPLEVAGEVQKAMGNTLGYIAIVIGLGAIFGEMLHRSGGAEAVARRLLDTLGEERAPTALGLTGLIVAIPVFFDVAFILFVPLLHSLTRRTGRPLIGYAIPLLAGLAVAHAFIPPTPGPVAVAGLLGAELGWVILFGLIAGIPALAVGGLWLGNQLSRGDLGQTIQPPETSEETTSGAPEQSFAVAMSLVALPLVLILSATASKVWLTDGTLRTGLQLIGHPFIALLLTVAAAWVWLGRSCGWSKDELNKMATASLEPVGGILLLTGAGGVLGKILLATGAGGVLAEGLSGTGMPLLVAGFITALSLRIAQGSATVSMVTSAGLIAPILESAVLDERSVAALVVAIAAGATAVSHVNDSGFWLVSRYLGMSEKQTLRSWTLMTSLVGAVGLASVLVASTLLAGPSRSTSKTTTSDSATASGPVESAASRPEPETVGFLEAGDEAFSELIAPDAKIEVLARGFKWSEGPVWVAQEQMLLFSDVPENRIYRWRQGAGHDVWLEPSGYTGDTPRGGEPGSNGLFLDAEGRLLLAQHGDRRVARLESPWQDGPFLEGKARFETLAGDYQGRRFHSPNDLVVHSRGDIFFTDPPYGLDGGPDGPNRELDFQGVYQRTPSGEVKLVTDRLSRPNGVILSPDERTLYVANSDPKRAVWMAYDPSPELEAGDERVFFDATAQVGDDRPGLPDGMAVDVDGRLFATGPGGVWIFDPSGEPLGTVRLPGPSANCTFGGPDLSDLFITADDTLLRLPTRTRGFQALGAEAR